MNNRAMQIAFRQYAQQMGMQNIRTLLPEQIDMLINSSIVDVLNQLIKEHIASTTEKGGSDNTKLSQINAFRNLYVVKEFDLDGLYPNNPPSGGDDNPDQGGEDKPGDDTPGSGEDDNPTDDTYYEIIAVLRGDATGAEISIDPAITGTLYGSDATRVAKAGTVKPPIVPTSTPTITTVTSTAYNIWPNLVRYSNKLNLTNAFHIVDSAIIYNIPTIKQETSWFPIRIVDEQYLAESLRDSFLRPTFKSPIGVYYNNYKIDSTFDFYVSRTKNNLIVPKRFKLSYIKVPKKVDYTKPDEETDMPINLHDVIIRHGVDLYRSSIGQQVSQVQPSQTAQYTD